MATLDTVISQFSFLFIHFFWSLHQWNFFLVAMFLTFPFQVDLCRDWRYFLEEASRLLDRMLKALLADLTAAAGSDLSAAESGVQRCVALTNTLRDLQSMPLAQG